MIRVRRVRGGSDRLPIAVHLAFWSATYVFFVLYFGRDARSYAESLLFVALLMPVAMGTTYFATGLLIPRFLLKRRYGLFALYAAYALVGSVYLELVVLVVSFMLLAGYDLEMMNPPALDVFGLVVGFYVVVFLAVAANLAMRWHRLRARHDDAENARLQAELALREAELERLKSQIQPHFLFNTLNNLYGLTLERSDDAPEVVLRISEMLDYVLYRCSDELVPLAGEVEHLLTYVELERLRYGERVDIELDVDDLPPGRIAPLLLTPFVENAFKHGAALTAGRSWVGIHVDAQEGVLNFRIENSKASKPANGQAAGIGLENVRRRLRLLYPNEHRLEVEDLGDRYAAHLRIPIHPKTVDEETRRDPMPHC